MKIFTFLDPRSLARRNLARNALYSVRLFEVGNHNARDTSIRVPSLFSNIMHVPLLVKLKAPLTKSSGHEILMAVDIMLMSGDSFPSSTLLVSRASLRAPSFFLYCLRCPSRISILTASLRWMESSVL